MPAKVDLEFRGVDAAECEAFIRAVTAHALSEEKQHDDQWMADFASSFFTEAGLRWWDGLEENVQRSWKSLRRAMLSRFQPTFSGGIGEEAEAFIRMVRQKAFEAGKFGDNVWMMAFASTCLVGDTMRWHASLDTAIQSDWRLFWPAFLAQYPRDAPSGLPPPNAKRRARIQIRRKADEKLIYYLSKSLYTNPNQSGRVMLTRAAVQALEVEYVPPVTKSQTLHIPDNQITGCDTLAIQWYYEDTTRSDNWIGLCGINLNSGRGSAGKGYAGPLSNTWELSPTTNDKGLRPLFGANGSARLFPASTSGEQNHIWFRSETKQGEFELEVFLEQV